MISRPVILERLTIANTLELRIALTAEGRDQMLDISVHLVGQAAVQCTGPARNGLKLRLADAADLNARLAVALRLAGYEGASY